MYGENSAASPPPILAVISTMIIFQEKNCINGGSHLKKTAWRMQQSHLILVGIKTAAAAAHHGNIVIIIISVSCVAPRVRTFNLEMFHCHVIAIKINMKV